MRSSYAELEMTKTSAISKVAIRCPLPILTSLRFFAATEVVIYHYTNKSELIPFYPFKTWATAGYQAVTFFFVHQVLFLHMSIMVTTSIVG
jgi:hypothetical protein